MHTENMINVDSKSQLNRTAECMLDKYYRRLPLSQFSYTLPFSTVGTSSYKPAYHSLLTKQTIKGLFILLQYDIPDNTSICKRAC